MIYHLSYLKQKMVQCNVPTREIYNTKQGEK